MKTISELMNELKDKNLALPIWFEKGTLKIIDQLQLPFKEVVYTLGDIQSLAKSIRDMNIRGSGAIGICGAYGIYLAALTSKGNKKVIEEAGRLLKSTRPTAVNLMKTVDEMLSVIDTCKDSVEVLFRVEQKAVEIIERQLQFEYELGRYGSTLINDGDTVMTYCHSGALAGSGYGGRALSVIRTAFEQGKAIHVIVCETRPYLQGARITAYELKKFGIPYTLITDNMSGYCMKKKLIQKVVVGSDRIAANGDLANKIGTYMHALVARENNIPFYTATSSHTIDFSTARGDEIEVELRSGEEVTKLNGQQIAPYGTKALYPSFDITPNHLISAIITEKGIIYAPYEKNLKTVMEYNNVAH
ncbi:S-methyl-5-thioribose-1-phosphate isomerase [Geobacillus thermodenitrificans]|uniref:S-methyl-5-thioribose-1-phosphate isomerase n=1 Tax=Geobacillus thermodenitrificans TaxID=33940 RepID=UPI002E20F10A|nr:S-methyl-5-thioribose-1-phosphate isomerase [Geobacillus thermodenitrificans]